MSETAVADRDEQGHFLPGNSMWARHRFPVGNPGRPNRYTPAEMAEEAAGYFEHCDTNEQAYAWADLALWLGMSRSSLDSYLHGEFGKTDEDKRAYQDILQRCKSALEGYRERVLVREKGNAAGAIFALKNHHGWRDEKHIQTTGTQEHRLIVHLDGQDEAQRSLQHKLEHGITYEHEGDVD